MLTNMLLQECVYVSVCMYAYIGEMGDCYIVIALQ